MVKRTIYNDDEVKADIIKLMKDNCKITTEEICDTLSIGHTKIVKVISELKKENKIRRNGKTNKGFWEIIEE